jgi:PTH1 family peptidyl-tRNA hydrolase
MDTAWLIVGLGNPGRSYARTRHNVGFMVVERLGRLWRASWKMETKFRARVARVTLGQKKILLCLPQTYMNASGEAVGAVSGFFRVALDHSMVVVDDADLALGEIRLRPKGSSGGHHGLESVENHLGSKDYARLRVGIGRGSSQERQIAGYVLSPFRGEDEDLVEQVLDRACAQVQCWMDDGIGPAMNRFNGRITSD